MSNFSRIPKPKTLKSKMENIRNNPFPSSLNFPTPSSFIFLLLLLLPTLSQSVNQSPLYNLQIPIFNSQQHCTQSSLIDKRFKPIKFLIFFFTQMASDQSDHQPLVKMPVLESNYSKRVLLKTILTRSDGGVGLVGERIVVGGWVKTSREMRKEQPVKPLESDQDSEEGPKDLTCVEVIQTRIPFFRTFIKVFGGNTYRLKQKLDSDIPKPPPSSVSILQISDGSCVASLQIMVDSSIALPSELMPTGTCVLAEGILQQPSTPGKHIIELKVEKVLHVGIVDQETYPLSKKRLPLDGLRECAHFRPRTTTVASVMRIRSALAQASHTFFQSHGFLYVQVPIITTTDTEGFSEKFQVTILLEKGLQKEDLVSMDDTANVGLEAVKASIVEKSKKVEELKRTESNREALAAAIQDLHKTNDLAAQLKAREKKKSEAHTKTQKIKFSEEFFSGQTYLTVSGRLHLESFACALGNVYSFGPTFRAEKSQSTKSLAEMWMVETEMAFSELEDAMNCADDFLKFLSKWVLENCSEDLNFVAKRIDKTLINRLQSVASSSFLKISYAEAVDVLIQAKEKKFENQIKLGVPLTEEHESYLTDEVYKRSMIIYNHPKEHKPFYVSVNDDEKTVATFDVIIPKVGTVIRGSQNEERVNQLSKRIKELGLPKEQYKWYLDLRRQGTVKHSGFSFVFDRMVLYASGLNDVRDAVPFPRYHGKLNN